MMALVGYLTINHTIGLLYQHWYGVVMAADPDVPWDLVSEVRRSRRKSQILRRLGESPAAATEVAEEINLKTGSVSNIFRDMKNTTPPLIYCLTPDQPHHRIYGLTETGEEVLKNL